MNKIKKVSKLKKFIFGIFLIFGLATCFSLVTSFAASPQNVTEDGIDYTFLVNPDNTATITKVDTHDKTECNIPSVLMGYPVKSIGTPTENMGDILQIVLSEDSNIPFYQCSNLESVTIPEGVESIGSLTFMDCPNLTNVIIPNTVTSIHFYAFFNCSGIQSLTIPHSVTSIGAKTFVCDENNHLGSFFISENAQVQTLSDPDNGDSITTIVPNSTIVYKYNVLDQTNVSEGKIPVEIVSARAECNHNESPEDDIDIPDTIDCGAMGEKYAINSISFTEVQLIHNLTHFNAIDPTCSSPGNREYWYCDQCEKYFDDAQGDTETEADSLIIGATGHNLAHHAATPATCTFPGNSEYWYCDQCEKYFNGAQGETEIEADSWVIGATGHAWSEVSYTWSQDNSTCTATRVCGNDNSHVETETVTATSEIKTEAACTTVGTTTYTAGFENEAFATQTKEVEDIPATGHNMTAHAAVAATCTTDGNSAYWSCDRCNKYFSDENGETEIEADSLIIGATGHAWSEVSYTWSQDNSTCTATRVCGNDNSHVETETVTATSAIKTEATCTAVGTTTYTAGFENEAFATQTKEVEDIPATGHNMTAHAAVAATCTKDGNSEYWYCDQCQKYFGDANAIQEIEVDSWIIAAAGHTLTAHEAKEPTCSEDGNSAYWSCSKCEKYFNDENGENEITTDSCIIPAAGHTWDANWSTDGSEHWHECSVCNEKKDEEAHNYDAVTTYVWKNNNKCTATRTCEICSYTEEEETSNITSTTTAATCTEAGSTVYTATFTNTAFNEGQDRVKTVDIPSTGHNMAAHAAVAATCTEAGNSAYWSCSKCGKYFGDENGETEIAENSWIIEAKGHNLAHFDAVDPTCTSPGNREYWYCDQCEKYFGDENATQEIEVDSWIIAAAHDLHHEDKVEPTETEDGHIAGWTCNICHKHFSDENGTQEITNWIIPHGSYQLGDVDKDGAITMQDLEALHIVLIGKKVMVKIRDDIDRDGIVTWQDLEALFQILLIQ